MHITFLFPRFKTFSGAEHLILKFANYARQQSHDVSILTRKFDVACLPYLDLGIDLRTPTLVSGLTGNHLIDSFLDIAASPFLLKYVPKQTDILCFLCDPTLPALWLYKRVMGGKIPTVYYCLQPPRFAYDLMAETVAANKPLGYLVPLFALPYRVIDKIAARSSGKIFVISEDYARWCRELYKTRSIQILYPGVDINIAKNAQPNAIRELHNLSSDTKLVVTVNKIIARKNLDVFLHAMKIVTEHISNVKGIIVGDGPVKSLLVDLTTKLALSDKIIFTGFVPDFSDVINYYAASDVYVFLEKNVPFGLTVLEAGICEKPVVAVRGGGTLDTMIDGESGFLVDADLKPEEIAEKICWLLENEEERIAMGQRAAQHAQSFAWDIQAQIFVDTLQASIANVSSP